MYSTQIRSATSPAVALPKPLRSLCLDCISLAWRAAKQYSDNRFDLEHTGNAIQIKLMAEGLAELGEDGWWDQSMADTHRTSYEGYHDKLNKRRAGTAMDTIIQFGTPQCQAAYDAVRGLQLDRWRVVLRMRLVLEKLRETGGKMNDTNEEELDMQSGKEAAQS